jgi:hypothetical protein
MHVSPFSLRSNHAHTNLPGRATCMASDSSLLTANPHLQLSSYQCLDWDRSIYQGLLDTCEDRGIVNFYAQLHCLMDPPGMQAQGWQVTVQFVAVDVRAAP